MLQRCTGDGIVFLAGGGFVVEKKLENETLEVNEDSLLAFSGVRLQETHKPDPEDEIYFCVGRRNL